MDLRSVTDRFRTPLLDDPLNRYYSIPNAESEHYRRFAGGELIRTFMNVVGAMRHLEELKTSHIKHPEMTDIQSEDFRTIVDNCSGDHGVHAPNFPSFSFCHDFQR